MRMIVPRLPGLDGPVDQHDDAVRRARDVGRGRASGMRATRSSSGGSSRSASRANSAGAELDVLGVGQRVDAPGCAQRDGSAPIGDTHRPHRPAGGEAAVDRLHALDEELAALLALAAVVAQRLEQLEARRSRARSASCATSAKGERPWLARSAASRRPSRNAGWAMAASASPRWCTVLPCSSAAPYSVTMMSTWCRGRGDHRAGLEPRDDARAQLVADRDGGRQAQQRPVVEVEGGTGDEVLVPADARVLHRADRVGDHLALDVDAHGGVDRDHRPVAADRLGRVHEVDGQERHLAVLVEPVVELAGAGREGGHRHAVVGALLVGDLARPGGGA